MNRISLILALLIWSSNSFSQVPFPCDGNFYQTLGTLGNISFYQVQVNPLSFVSISNLTNQGLNTEINSIAFNPVDNLIYGINPDPPYELYQIDALGNLANLGIISPPLTGRNQAGSMDNLGNFFVTGSGGMLYSIDVTSSPPTSVLLGSPNLGVDDITYNTNDGYLYGFDETVGRLFKISTINGTSTAVGPVDNRWGPFGALYFNPQGNIYGYGDDKSIPPSSSQETFAEIDPATGIISPVDTGIITRLNDGTSCSFGIELSKVASVDTVTSGDTFSYVFTIFNSTGTGLSNVTFSDTLVNELIWYSEPRNLANLAIGPTSITGTNLAIFTIDSIGPGVSSFVIDVEVKVSCSGSFFISNIAHLSNLPAVLGGQISSDNTITNGVGNPTFIFANCGVVVPTLKKWALIILGLLILCLGAIAQLKKTRSLA